MTITTNPLRYSFIIPYRDREEHLVTFLAHMKRNFSNLNIEYIIVEQNDLHPFRRGCLLNDGAKRATGDILVLHDVDYLPDASTSYWEGDAHDVYQPVKRVNFINMDGSPKLPIDIPPGYRHFSTSVDDNFYGAVTCFTREAFFKINGFNPLYDGWGLEDADLRERINQAKLRVHRGNGTFSALPHPDSFPGNDNEKFQNNTKLFHEWSKWIDYGVSNSFPATGDSVELAEHYHVDLWTKSTSWAVSAPHMKQFFSVAGVTQFYEDTPEKHTLIWNSFKHIVNATDYLKQHRDWVVHNRWGYGNRSFWWNFNLLIREAPEYFKALEIGVFKGSTVSLISLLNKVYNKHGQIFGITPLNNTGDKYGTHPDINYELAIQQIYGQFDLDASDLTIIEGYSQESEIINAARSNGPYDLIYVDGCHDYDVVFSDISNYSALLKLGGYLIIDDASNDLNIPDGLIRLDWRGLPEVTQATNDTVDKNSNFKLIYAVGHNKVYKRIL